MDVRGTASGQSLKGRESLLKTGPRNKRGPPSNMDAVGLFESSLNLACEERTIPHSFTTFTSRRNFPIPTRNRFQQHPGSHASQRLTPTAPKFLKAKEMSYYLETEHRHRAENNPQTLYHRRRERERKINKFPKRERERTADKSGLGGESRVIKQEITIGASEWD
ncbi:hypothetical protein TNCV_4248591 [Trichonephila clavipes]|nr:hypothetical protein TNCV_4248591 [Trichonephila clavipes]